MTKQPNWKRVAQLGDANPCQHGGFWVFVDTTGVYPPEAELLEVSDDEGGEAKAYRIILEPCTYVHGILSDNPFHPEHPAWFTDKLNEVANVCGLDDPFQRTLLIEQLTSDDPIKRALGYRELISYFGAFEFDQYPSTYTSNEVAAKYEFVPFKYADQEMS